jgi:hypothetical protein
MPLKDLPLKRAVEREEHRRRRRLRGDFPQKKRTEKGCRKQPAAAIATPSLTHSHEK